MPREFPDEDHDLDDWEVEGNRPEDEYETPGEYWTAEAIERLLKAKGQSRIQHDLAVKTLTNLSSHFPGILEIDGSSPVTLDIGCGLGFASDVLVDAGFTSIGIDIIADMAYMSSSRDPVDYNARRGRYHRVLASATCMPFRYGMIGLAISTSALQWLETTEQEAAFAAELAHVIAIEGAIAFQYYPRSSQDLMQLGSTIKQFGFEGGLLVENVKNPRKRKNYLLARKAQNV
jgi:SAM-dependent methyltransferase